MHHPLVKGITVKRSLLLLAVSGLLSGCLFWPDEYGRGGGGYHRDGGEGGGYHGGDRGGESRGRD